MITAPITGLVSSNATPAVGMPRSSTSTNSTAGAATENAQPLPVLGETVVLSSNSGAGRPREGSSAKPELPGGKSDVSSQENALSEKVRKLNEQMRQSATQIEFSIDQDTKDVVVRVLNKETGEVIRQMPPDEVMHLAKVSEDIRGRMFNRMS
jgi:flagellar protein FlaG